MTGRFLTFYVSLLKPAMDILAGWVLLIIFLPLLLSIAAILFFSNKGKVFFVQKRAGAQERIFRLYKFRTLSDIHDENGILLPDILRQTHLGNLLRHYHLDELPQLLNVATGSLSLVGPRPLLVDYLPYYTSKQRKRHIRRPGMTGLAQVMGGNSLSWHLRLKFDVFYVEKCSPWLDMIILWRSVMYLLKKESTFSNRTLFSESFIHTPATGGFSQADPVGVSGDATVIAMYNRTQH